MSHVQKPDTGAQFAGGVVGDMAEAMSHLGNVLAGNEHALGVGTSRPAPDGRGTMKVLNTGADLLEETAAGWVVQIDLDTEKGAKTVLIGATSDGSYRLESHQGGNVNVRQLLQGELFSVEAVVGQPLSGLQPNPSVGRRITFGANTVKRVVLLGHRGFDPLPPPITPAPAPTSAPTVRAVASVPTGAARGRVRTPAIGTATVEKFDPTGLTELAAASIADPRRQVDFLEKALTHPRDLSAWLHSVGPGARGRTVVARALLDVQQAIVGECTTRAAELGSLGLPFTELVTTIQQIAPGLAGKGDAVAPAIPGL